MPIRGENVQRRQARGDQGFGYLGKAGRAREKENIYFDGGSCHELGKGDRVRQRSGAEGKENLAWTLVGHTMPTSCM